jgi:hypothetical protein
MPVPDVFELAIADSWACAEISVGTYAASRQLARGPEDCDDAAGGNFRPSTICTLGPGAAINSRRLPYLFVFKT